MAVEPKTTALRDLGWVATISERKNVIQRTLKISLSDRIPFETEPEIVHLAIRMANDLLLVRIEGKFEGFLDAFDGDNIINTCRRLQDEGCVVLDVAENVLNLLWIVDNESILQDVGLQNFDSSCMSGVTNSVTVLWRKDVVIDIELPVTSLVSLRLVVQQKGFEFGVLEVSDAAIGEEVDMCDLTSESNQSNDASTAQCSPHLS